MTILQESVERTGIVAVKHGLFRLLVTTILESELGFTRVVTANSLDDAVDRLADVHGTGLALFDVEGSGMAEASNLALLRECFPKIRLVVCGPMRRADVLHALHGGVHGYVSEEMGIEQLTQALSAVVAGGIFVPAIVADVTPNLSTRIAAQARRSRGEDLDPVPSPGTTPEFHLTPRQIDVLRLIIHGQSNKEIARALDLRESTVKVHIAAIFRALGVHNRSGAAGIGTRFIVPASDHLLGWATLPEPSA